MTVHEASSSTLYFFLNTTVSSNVFFFSVFFASNYIAYPVTPQSSVKSSRRRSLQLRALKRELIVWDPSRRLLLHYYFKLSQKKDVGCALVISRGRWQRKISFFTFSLSRAGFAHSYDGKDSCRTFEPIT